MTPISALKLVRPIAPHPLAGRPVLESAPLRPGCKRSALSRFEDSTWDLAARRVPHQCPHLPHHRAF